MANERTDERDQEYCRALRDKYNLRCQIPDCSCCDRIMSALLEAVQTMRDRADVRIRCLDNEVDSNHWHGAVKRASEAVRALTLTAKDVKP